MHRILSKSTRHFIRFWLEIFAVACALFLIIGAVLLVRLSQGPLPLTFVTNPLQQAINNELSDYQVSVDVAQLVWDGDLTPIELQMKGVEIREKQSGIPLIRMGRLGVDVSKRALLERRLFPKTLSIYNPVMRVYRGETGGFSLRVQSRETNDNDVTETMIGNPAARQELWVDFIDDYLQGAQEKGAAPQILKYLDTIRIIDADVVLNDEKLERDFILQDTRFVLRRTDNALVGTLDSHLRLDKILTPVQVNFHYSGKTRESRILTRYQDMPFADLATFLPKDITDIYGATGTSSGAFFMLLGREIKPQRLRLNLNSYDGIVRADNLFPRPVSYQSLAARAAYEYATGHLTVPKFDLRIGASSLNATADYTARPDTTDVSDITINAVAENVAIDDLDLYWPQPLGPPARKWVTDNISDGTVPKATLNLEIIHDRNTQAENSADNKAFTLADISGVIDFKKGTVRYLPDFPEIMDVDGQAHYSKNDFVIKTTGGTSGRLAVDRSEITIKGFENHEPRIDIGLTARGPAAEALSLIDRQPFRLAQKLNLPVQDIAGTAVARLEFDFPLSHELTPADVTLNVDADLDNVSWKNVALGQDISQGDVTLDIADDRMDVGGTVQMRGAPVSINWTGFFNGAGPYKAQLKASTVLNRDFFNLVDGLKPFQLAGEIPTDIVYTRHADNSQTARLSMNLRPLNFTVPVINIDKAVGVDGSAVMTLDLREGGGLTAVHDLNVQTSPLAFQGRVDMARNGDWQQAVLKNVRFLQNRFDISVTKKSEHRYDADLSGPILDISPYVSMSGASNTKPETPKIPRRSTLSPRLRVEATVDRLITAKNAAVNNAAVFMVRNEYARLDRLELDGTTGRGQIYLRYYPDDRERHHLRLEADDAGAALRSFGITDSIRGGMLIVDGTPIERGGLRDMQGRFQLSNFTVVDAPVLARLLNGLSLSGLQSLLAGEGVSFARLKAGFIWNENVNSNGQVTRKIVKINDGATSGASLGLTFDGSVDVLNGRIDSHGTIVPVSGISQAVGEIPLLGDILTGGGKGIFAATYTVKGPLSAPTITVNPLAALAPGILRTIFFENE